MKGVLSNVPPILFLCIHKYTYIKFGVFEYMFV